MKKVILATAFIFGLSAHSKEQNLSNFTPIQIDNSFYEEIEINSYSCIEDHGGYIESSLITDVHDSRFVFEHQLFTNSTFCDTKLLDTIDHQKIVKVKVKIDISVYKELKQCDGPDYYKTTEVVKITMPGLTWHTQPYILTSNITGDINYSCSGY